MNFDFKGSGCGTIGWAVASYTGDPQFEYSNQRYFLLTNELKRKKEKEAGNSPTWHDR